MTRHLLKTLIAALAIPVLLISCKKEGGIENLRFTVSSESFRIGTAKRTLDLTVSSPSTWTISSDQSWAVPSTTGGNSGRTKITVSVGENTGDNSRKATLTVKSNSASAPLTVVITQNGLNGGPSADVNEWIFTTLESDYYWNKAVRNATPKYDLEYDEFLEDLIVNLKGAQDSDGTMDGYVANGQRHVYSYIDRTPVATRSESIETTFGFGFEAFYANEFETLFTFLVTWVLPGGPADKAGLKRGMWITKYNNRPITYDDYTDFFYKIYYLEGGTNMTLGLEDGKTVTVNAAAVENSPILFNDVLTSPGGKKVAYFVYNSFESGEREGGDRNNPRYRFDNQMRDAFVDFANRGAAELVVDLRYNLGGLVACCQLLTSLIADVNSSKVFGKLKFNEEWKYANPEIWKYLDGESSLKLGKVYVLAKGDTASSSEMVINSLRSKPKGPGVNVIHIGEQTNGKNIGMQEYTQTFDGYEYIMYPINFRIYNADDQSDYTDGFVPDFQVDEFRNHGEAIYELGDPREELLKQALAHIDGGAGAVVTDDMFGRTRSAVSRSKAPLPGPLPRGGAIVPHDHRAASGQQ